MTNEEAKKNVNTYLMMEFENIPQQVIQALEVYSEANEKQISKKPNLIEDKMWTCPNCDNNLQWKYKKYPYELNDRGLDYCLCCGQAIDWSDEKVKENDK